MDLLVYITAGSEEEVEFLNEHPQEVLALAKYALKNKGLVFLDNAYVGEYEPCQGILVRAEFFEKVDLRMACFCLQAENTYSDVFVFDAKQLATCPLEYID